MKVIHTYTHTYTSITDIRYQQMVQGLRIPWVCIPCRERENQRVASDYGPSNLIPDIQEEDVANIENPPAIEFTENPTYSIITNGNICEGVSINILIY